MFRNTLLALSICASSAVSEQPEWHESVTGPVLRRLPSLLIVLLMAMCGVMLRLRKSSTKPVTS